MTDYTDLQATIGSFLNREDLTSVIPTFVAMAEAELSRVLDTPEMVTFISLDINSERILLPDNFAGVKSFRLSDVGYELVYRAPEAMDLFRNRTERPSFYSIIGDSFTFWPNPGSGPYAAKLRYRTRLEPLATAGTNWLIQKHLDAYLYGSLKHAAPYLIEDERLQVWQNLFAGAVQQINEDARKQLQGAVMRVSAPGVATV